MRFSASNPLNSTPNPVVTSMAGFAGLVFPLLEGVSLLVLGLGLMLGFGGVLEPVVTGMAGFAGCCLRLPGGATAIPAAFRYRLAVSRRTPVSCWMRRNDHPNCPSAITCCLVCSLKTLLMPSKAKQPLAGVNVRSRFS